MTSWWISTLVKHLSWIGQYIKGGTLSTIEEWSTMRNEGHVQKILLNKHTKKEWYTSEEKAQTQGVHSLGILIFSKIFIVFNWVVIVKLFIIGGIIQNV